ncbi:MAG: MFS transporter, partial [Rhabdochlamydiaceae bacterium]
MSMSAGIGAGVASLLLYLVDPFSDPTSFWKWRLLLIFGIIGIFVANYLKNTFGETEFFRHYKKRHHKTHIPLFDVCKNSKLTFLRVVGITILAPIITLTIYAWVPQFSVKHLDLTAKHSMLLNFGSLVLFSIGARLFGARSDKWGRRRILLGVSGFFLLFGYPLFAALYQTETVLQFFLIQATLAFASSAYYGVAMTACIEHVPTHIRYTGVALAYYVNYAFFGGISGDHIEKMLIENNYLSSPIFYLMSGSFIVLVCSYFLKEEAGRVLSDNYNQS